MFNDICINLCFYLISHLSLLDDNRFRVEDGCPTRGQKVDGSVKRKSFKACVRCCSNDGMTCSTPLHCGKHDNLMTYDDAELKCKESGARLCKKEELLNNVCCGTGGMGDSKPVWALSPAGKTICTIGYPYVR